MLVPKLSLTSIKIRIFGQKMAQIGPKYLAIFGPKRPNLNQNRHFWSIMCPVGESVGGCGARAVSLKTPIYFLVDMVKVKIAQYLTFEFSLLAR